MRLITVQHRSIIEYLRQNKVYHVDDRLPVASNLVEPYKFMMKHYQYKHRPIFCCPVGFCCNFGGCNDREGSYIIEMEVPDKLCRIQDYYGWSDFIYFTELPNEFSEFKGLKTVKQFGVYVLDMYRDKNSLDRRLCYQVTIPSIHRSWIKKIIPVNKNFSDMYVNTGGENILQSII